MKSATPNRLIHETSPYLLQHAHNPVNWYPWSDEALQKAKNEDKPILVSIGYAACHWCHVMERESFEDETVAAFMNQHFINIKIDREERPDLDHIYMDAVQAMTGSGGWPLNVFLTTDAKPFYGGTYFPPKNAFNRPSWMQVLESVADAFTTKKHEIESQSENLTQHLIQSNQFGNQTNAAAEIAESDLHAIFQNILKSADRQEGGFGKAPKFPQFAVIQFLLKYAYQYNSAEALQQATLSIDKIIYGGIYDHLGGGMARYSTDNEWLVPHFEKMLYDNALLVITLSEAYQLTKKPQYLRAINQTMAFIKRDMMHENGGFYSAIDADSEGEEGKYYVWSKQEVEEAIGKNAPIFCAYFDITEEGNWEGAAILRIKKPAPEFAKELGMPETDFLKLIDDGIALLLEKRYIRVAPQLDDKIILSWNALMNTACSKAFAATGNNGYRQMAISNIKFLLNNFEDNQTGKFHHTFKNGMLKFPAFLDDYAYLIHSLIHLQEITGENSFLQEAKKITTLVLVDFSELSSGFFYYTGQNQLDVIVRKKEVYDGAMPSGNAVMAFNLQYLGTVFDNDEWVMHSKKISLALLTAIKKYPVSFGAWACGLYSILYAIPLIILTGEELEDLRNEILFIFIPYKILQSVTREDENFPLLVGKNTNLVPKIYLCKNNTCLDPVTSVDLFVQQLKK